MITAKEIQNDAKHFTCIISFNPLNDFKSQVLLLIPFYSWVNPSFTCLSSFSPNHTHSTYCQDYKWRNLIESTCFKPHQWSVTGDFCWQRSTSVKCQNELAAMHSPPRYLVFCFQSSQGLKTYIQQRNWYLGLICAQGAMYETWVFSTL